MTVPPIRLSDLAAGTGGFALYGRDNADSLGGSVASAGDINGDGFDDLIIGADNADGLLNTTPNAGEAYVIFGKATGFGASVDLAAIAAGNGGFVVVGRDAGDVAGRVVASAGDVNGDGLGDFLIGAPWADGPANAASESGEAYIVFGKTTGFGSGLSLETVAAGTGGAVFYGLDAYDGAGGSLASAGDINGDEFDDFLIAAYSAAAAGNAKPSAGETYVFFGTNAGFGAGTPGFTILGAAAYNQSGRAVSSAGDLDGDGFDDLIIASYHAEDPATKTAGVGVTTVLFGKEGGFAPTTDLATFTGGVNGFSIVGRGEHDRAGSAVAAAGDVNGDGFADIIISSSIAQESYVVFGKTGGFGARIDLSAVAAGTGGFVLRGIDADDGAGGSLASVGDVNGDGIDDLIIGAQNADGPLNTTGYAGEAYVVFGRSTGFAGGVDLSAIASGVGGFAIFNADAYEFAANSVASAGDINGDGFDDIIVGVGGGNGPGNAKPGAGEAYVVFGRDFTGTVTHPGTSGANTLTGSAGANVIVGGQGADTLIGLGGADALTGGVGDDVIRVSDLTFLHIDGGHGTDTLGLDAAGLTLDLGAISNLRIQGIERIDLTGTSANTLVVTALELLNLSDTGNALRVDGNAGDIVSLSGESWTTGKTEGGYTQYTQGQAALSIATTVTVTGLQALPAIEIADLVAGKGGFAIWGANEYDQSGVSVRSAGDIDGDGFDDIIVGAHFANGLDIFTNTTLVSAGGGGVIYGRASGFGPPIDLGVTDFVFEGIDPGDFTGWSVASAGDINGDGFHDLLIGAPQGDAEFDLKPNAGDSYIIFGNAGRVAYDLSSISYGLHNVGSPLRGVVLYGPAAGAGTGFSVASAGDLNGDGFDDIVIGGPSADRDAATDSGLSYVVFGQASWQDHRLELAELANGTQGFVVRGRDGRDGAGYSVASAGDINGDGLDDLLIGAPYADGAGNAKAKSGETYVVFGRTGGFGATVELSRIASGLGGFVVYGQGTNTIGGDQSGVSVASAGDFNGDGFADLIIGARFANPVDPTRLEAGAGYLIFGKASGFGASIDLAAVAGGAEGWSFTAPRRSTVPATPSPRLAISTVTASTIW